MPRVNSLTPEKRIEDKIYRQILGAMGMEGVRKCQIAEVLGLHKSTVTQHFEHHTFSVQQLIEILTFLGLEIQICAKSV